jgi:hypothetical protein
MIVQYNIISPLSQWRSFEYCSLYCCLIAIAAVSQSSHRTTTMQELPDNMTRIYKQRKISQMTWLIITGLHVVLATDGRNTSAYK